MKDHRDLLTPEKARLLTNRELALLLHSVIRTMNMQDGIELEQIRSAVGVTHRMLSKRDQGFEWVLQEIILPLKASDPAVAGLSMLFHGICSGWEHLGEPGAMMAALNFYIECESVWGRVGADWLQSIDFLRQIDRGN